MAHMHIRMSTAANQQLRECSPARVLFHSQLARQPSRACTLIHRRQLLAASGVLPLLGLLPSGPVLAVEQGILPSDYTVPALGSAEYIDKIRQLRGDACAELRALAEAGRFTELANGLVLSPIDDIRQAVLYIPAALLKEGRQQAAIASRREYTSFIRDLKRLDETAMGAARYDKDEEDVIDAIGRLGARLDAVIRAATQ